MYSSSCSSKLVSHSNGKLYFVGIINSENPKGNLPRYPLCIAEINQQSLRVIKESVFVLDTKPDGMDDTLPESYPVDFSNHWAYEDEKGRIVVIAPFRPDLCTFNGVLNRYEISVD